MNTDDSQRGGMQSVGNRKLSPQKYPEKMPNYSPSTSYNYSPATGVTGGQQHPRRRNDRFKRESLNLSDKVAKQNDIIIRLLKEIRDRLPPPPPGAQKTEETVDTASLDSVDSIEESETDGEEQDEQDGIPQ
jgi:hypothetical protein